MTIPHLEIRTEYTRRELDWLEAGAPEGKEPWRGLRQRRIDSDMWMTACPHQLWRRELVYEWKPRRIHVTLMNGEEVSWDEPMREAPKPGQRVFVVTSDYVAASTCVGAGVGVSIVDSGRVHLTEAAAEEHLEALRKINAQGVGDA